MKRYIGSLLLAMVFALGLLPTTALAAGENAPATLYVGNQQVISGTETTYWSTNNSGELTQSTENNAWNVKYDPSTVTLTLKNATIEGVYDNVNTSGAGIYAASSSGPVSLNIVLEEENKVSGMYGINVSSGGDASLNISGSGSLTVSGLSGNGIGIFMSSQNSANLTIEEASVTALGSQDGGSGVRLITSQTGSPSLTIEVKGGSLQASGETNGIHFLSNVNDATAVANLKVSGNAMVKASNIITTKDGTGSAPELKPAASGSDGTGGIIWDGKDGTVYGNVTLDENLTIGEGESLTIPKGTSLDMNGNTITVASGGKLEGTPTGGTVVYGPTVTTQPTGQTVTEGETATFTVEATGTEPLSYQWQQSAGNGNSWRNIDGATSATYTTGATTTSMNGTQYRCVVSNSAGSVTSDVAALTVNKHVHTWGDPVWSWSEDGKTCTVTFTCQNDETHKGTPAVTVTSAVKTPATCTEKGVTTYTATVEFNGKTYTDTKEVADVSATGHSWGEPVWSWSEDGKNCTVTFTCTKDQSHTVSPTVKITSAVKTPATCQAKGVTTYTATAELDGKTYTSTKDVTDIPLGNHVAKWEGDYPATCDRNGREGTATCTVCGKVLVEDKVIPAPGHKYGEPVWTWSKDGKSCTVTFTCSVCGYASENKATVTTKTSTEATCTQPGTATQQAQVVFNGNTYTTTKGNVTLAALGHNYKDGKCTRCGQADPNAKPAATASVTTGANGKWQTDSTQGLSFTYAGDGKFLRVQVNGTTLKEDQYQQQGNTVTLTQEYLKTLDPGSYTLVIALENSSAKTTFTVEQPAQATPVPTPQPTQQPEEQEDSKKSGNLLWIALAGGAAVLLIGGVAFLRFKNSLYD